MLLADTSQSSFGTSISSPSQMHLQPCTTQIQLPSTSATGFNTNLAHPPNLGFSTHDAKVALFRRHSPKLPYYSSSMPNPNNSLQTNLIGSGLNPAAVAGGLPPTNLNSRMGLVNNRIRPQFRKCQSQPSRSLSPGSIRSYSPLLLDPLNPAANQYTLNRMQYNRNEMNALASRNNSPLKRQLPQPPNLNHLNMSLNVTNNYNLHPASFDSSMMDSMGAYQPPVNRYGPSAAFAATGHSSALSNYEINRYKQYSKSSILLPYNRSLDGVRSPQGMYSDSELNRQYHPSSFGYRSQQQPPFAQQPYRANQPLFYHQYHRDGDYTTLTRQEMEEELNRNLHRHVKGKQKQQTYYSDVRDAREEQQYLKEQHPAKHQPSSDDYDAQDEQPQPPPRHSATSHASDRTRSLRKSSLTEADEQYDKSFDASDRSALQPTNGTGLRHGGRKLSGHHLDDDQLGAITSVDQLDEQLTDLGVLSNEEILEQNQRIARNGDGANKHRSRIRNKAYSGVINESGGEESESSSLSKSITSTVSDCKKTGSRTVGLVYGVCKFAIYNLF